MSNPIKQLLGQTAIYGLSSIVGRLLNYLLVPLYTYVFIHTADYGVVSELYAWVAFLIVLLTFGMETTFFKLSNDLKDIEKTFDTGLKVLTILNGIFLIVVFLLSQPIANAMLFSDHVEYILLLGIIVALDALAALPLARLRALNQAKKFALIQLSSIGVNIALNLIFLLVFFDNSRPEEGVLFILIANLLASLTKCAFFYKNYLKINLQFDTEMTKKMVVYALPLVVAGFAGIINETLDRILLKHLLYDGVNASSLRFAESQVGIYSACYKLAMLISIFVQAYRYAAEPFFFNRSTEKNRDKLYAKVMNYFLVAVCLAFLVVSLNIDVFKHFIRNEAYWEGLGVIPILLMANIFLGIYFNQSIWYKLSGQTKFGAYIAIGGAALTILINVLFIPIYGFWASAWATLIVYIAQVIASYYLGQRFYPIKYNLRKFFLYLSLSLLLFFLVRQMEFDSFALTFVIRNFAILSFVAFAWWLEKPSKQVLNPKVD